ncbi:amidohydrolase [Methylomarinovum caldicuralii]|uniref:Amidohydrolase n=1 Tax=Methylomarinovum caldicuralii TaxID=438856 RepID=A0AAU9C6B4_9GAMM|nr:M20 family metallopeptidase [Methylomarinovum caldicuralii]BCX81464.1 amidohydrolase [Methylomarinovum caldicuralii]
MFDSRLLDELYPHWVELRRAFHREPELAFEEVETAKKIMAELDRLGIPYTYQGKGGGVIGHIEGGRPGPQVALRADMDALPGEELTGLPFASRFPGRVHACGHDAHLTMVLGAAALLQADPPPGKVVLVFQPAEERGGGARVILASGALDQVRAIFGGHVTHHYRVGEIMIGEGVVTAQSDRFQMHIHGRGGHGARPHEAIDAVVIAGSLITTVQTLVSREVDPLHPSVVTVGQVSAGTAPNVIAAEARLAGTIRTTDPQSRRHLHAGLKRMARALGELHRARIELEIQPGYPPVINSPQETEIARRAAAAVVGDKGVVPMEHPSMGSEDFAFYLEKIPGCYVRFGARRREDEYIPLHSPQFDINEEVLKVGAAWFARVAWEAIHAYSA